VEGARVERCPTQIVARRELLGAHATPWCGPHASSGVLYVAFSAAAWVVCRAHQGQLAQAARRLGQLAKRRLGGLELSERLLQRRLGRTRRLRLHDEVLDLGDLGRAELGELGGDLAQLLLERTERVHQLVELPTLFVRLFTLLPELLRPIAEYRMIIYSLLLIVLMLVRPQGLFNFKLGKKATTEALALV
jgi:hypothetical protein